MSYNLITSELSLSEGLDSLSTEQPNADTYNIDALDTPGVLALLHHHDLPVASSIGPCLPALARAVDATVSRIRDQNGRVFYLGSGTSGRLGVLDASEIPPTFNAPAELFVGLIAGGDSALRSAAENAEDVPQAAAEDLKRNQLTSRDVVMGIAASGRTPYSLGAVAYGKQCGAYTIGLCCTDPSELSRSGSCDEILCAVVGPESLTGSTRLKAGTATKLLLNLFSSAVMIRLGKVYHNLMVDLRVSNHKLALRARSIIRHVAKDHHPDISINTDKEIDILLQRCGNSVKLAIATAKTGLNPEAAAKKLELAGGRLSVVLDDAKVDSSKQVVPEEPLILCVDGGGSSTNIIVATTSGKILAQRRGGSTNFTTHGAERIISVIQNNMPAPFHATQTAFSKVWIALAGFDREGDYAKLRPAVEKLLRSTDPKALHLSNDALLNATWTKPQEQQLQQGVVLLAGTGSAAFAWTLGEDGLPIKKGRAGGWGSLLGDDGSAFAIGRSALRLTLASIDRQEKAPSQLSIAIQEHFQSLSTELVQADRSQIAGCAQVVASAALEKDKEAGDILEAAAEDLVQLVHTFSGGSAPSFAVSYGGSVLAHNQFLRAQIDQGLGVSGTVISDAAANGIAWMTQ